MDDDVLSITGRPVPRIGPITTTEWQWLWNSICPLLFLPRHVFQHDWIGAAMWSFLLAAGIVRSRRPAVLRRTWHKILLVSMALVAGALVFLVRDPAWRVVGLAIAPLVFVTNWALAKRAHQDGQAEPAEAS